MQPFEIWWLVDAKRPPKRFGSLFEHDVEEIFDDMVERGLIKDPR